MASLGGSRLHAVHRRWAMYEKLDAPLAVMALWMATSYGAGANRC
jgi:hypothetical protein